MHPRPKRSKATAKQPAEEPPAKRRKGKANRSNFPATEELPTDTNAEAEQKPGQPVAAGSQGDGKTQSTQASTPARLLSPVPDFHHMSDDEFVAARWQQPWVFSTNDSIHLRNVLWPSLRRAIRAFNESALPQVASWDPVDEDTKQLLVAFAPNAKHYIDYCSKNGLNSQAIYEAWIWRILYDHLFSRNSVEKWRPGPWTSFGQMHRAMKGKIKPVNNALTCTFFSWKSDSARMLYTFHGSHSDSSRLKHIIKSQLRVFIEAKDKAPERFDAKLDTLVELAIEIDLMVIASRRDIRIEMCDIGSSRLFGFPFNAHSQHMKVSEFMELTQPASNGQRVDFITEPLVRYFGERNPAFSGNIYHELQISRSVKNYDLETVMFPMCVAVEQFDLEVDENEDQSKKPETRLRPEGQVDMS